ncbi:MAG: ATP-grasp domain-containing protein [Candidatus Bathyarchaeia archaeon]|nr:ATP-grasp domain-containing protein [Candidatus Bathyarchaeia archaeon]
MEKVGILVVSYGARESAIIDAFTRSTNYDVKVFVVDKQRNPFNVKKAAKHVVVPDLNVEEICKFAENHKDEIDFGIVGPEKPIIDGVRNIVEERTGIPLICPKKEYAIEASKVQQRLLFQKIVPEVNPRFKIFNPKDYKTQEEVKKAVYEWLDALGDKAVVKPDQPAAGKGVGVWGDHFTTREQLFEHFMANFQHGAVIIEEKIDGEESSFQAFCDGKHLVPLPETRDYKRAFDGDKGPNTGGMGSYKDVGDFLPFMSETDRAKEIEIVKKIFEKWDVSDAAGLRGIPFYVAFMHTGEEPKILENNSRPGDPEIINILPILKEDFVDVCFKILDGNLTKIELEKEATVVTYKVPPNYGGYAEAFPQLVNKNEVGKPVDLTKAYELTKKYGNKIRVYPASMELRNSETYALKSRAVAVVGISPSIEEARQISLEGINAIKGGALWHRTDIASKQHIEKSIRHIEKLRFKSEKSFHIRLRRTNIKKR